MYTYQLESCGTKQFIFEFSFDSENLDIVENENLERCYVKYRLLRKDKPEQENVFYWEGYLSFNHIETFQLSFQDKIDIKGKMKLFNSNDQNFIWINTFYCYNLENHFEGNIISIPGNVYPIPIPPTPINPTDNIPDPQIPDQEIILPAGYNDLFPYLYLRKWPNLTKMEEAYFLNYEYLKPSPFTSNLYTELLSFFNSNGVPKPKARENIVAAAFEFVNGSKPYEGQYITDTYLLPEPYNIYPAIYDILQEHKFTCDYDIRIIILNELKVDFESLSNTKNKQKPIIDRLWQNVFALSILNFYNIIGLENEIKILLVSNIVEYIVHHPTENNQSKELKHLIEASIVLPSPVFPLPSENSSFYNTSQINGTVVPYAIGDLHMIQHKLIGYRPGEIAHIENVLPGEIKERSNASSHEISETTIDTNETTLYKDNQWETRLEGFNTEIGNTLKGNETNTDDYNNLQTSYGPPTTGTYTGKVTLTKKQDLNDKTNDTQFAKKVLDQTIARMNRNIKHVFTRQQVKKTEEAVVHTLDNRNGECNVRGIYNWVNKVYSTRVINYGNRFLLEFLIDKPFPKIESDIALIENGLIPPANRLESISSFKSITRENYAQLTADYGVTNSPLPPDEYKTSYVLFNDDKMTAQMLSVEDGYVPYKAEVGYSTNEDMKLLVGGTTIDLKTSSNSKLDVKLDAIGVPEYSTVAIPVLLNEVSNYSSPPSSIGFYVSVGVQSTPSDRLMNSWKVSVYDAIIKAYKENVKMAIANIDEEKKQNKSREIAWVNQSIINSCKTILYKINLEKNEVVQSPVSSPPTDDINEPSFYQFFDQAMEWEECTYEFYQENNFPKDNKINQRIQNFYNGESFTQHLEDKHLRVMVPVVPNFNYKMLYYLSSGLIPYTENIITPVVESTKPIVVALKTASEIYNEPSITNEPWEISVPTNMQWLIDDDELPFYDETINPII